jgi:hypothetical protein
MVQLIGLAVGTFTIICVVFAFSITWVILLSLKVPDALAFVMALVYSNIPIYIYIRDEWLDAKMKGDKDVPLLQDVHSDTHIVIDDTPAVKIRKRNRTPKEDV